MKIHFLQTVWSDIIILQEGTKAAFVDTGMEDQFPVIREYLDMKHLIEEKSTLCCAEDTREIRFGDAIIQLYSTMNTIRTVYEDKAYPETYHRYAFSENRNSLAALMKIYRVNVFLGGDIQEEDGIHPLTDHMTRKVAEQIKEQIDIYKAPHHGTRNTAGSETLSILRPRYAVITNGEEFLSTGSDVYDLLKEANPEVKIRLTEKATVVCTISQDGSITFGY